MIEWNRGPDPYSWYLAALLFFWDFFYLIWWILQVIKGTLFFFFFKIIKFISSISDVYFIWFWF
jgi:hypothetical protein